MGAAVMKVHYDLHKFQIVQAFACRAERFLEDHPWQAHRHEMPHMQLGFTTDSRIFVSRDQLWNSLQDGWYHAEDLQELRMLTRETVKDLDFVAWKASHRHFLPGYHIYSCKNLAFSSENFDAYLSRMRSDMEKHYAGEYNRLYARDFTPKMRAWLEPYARIIWMEARVAAAVHRICVKDDGRTVDELVAAVWASVPELGTELTQEQQAIKRCHVGILVGEARRGGESSARDLG